MADERLTDASERRPPLQEVLRRAIKGRISGMHTMIAGAVSSWDPVQQRASVKILVKQPYFDEEGVRKVESVSVIPGVPVIFPGAGEFRVTCPISDGSGSLRATSGALFFAERSLDKWLTGTGAEVDPEIDHLFDITDAAFVPGMNPFGSPWAEFPTDRMTIGSDSEGNSRLEILDEGRGMLLGAGATLGVARKDDSTTNGWLVFNPGTGGAGLSWVAPGNPPPVFPPPLVVIPLSGVIDSFSSLIKSV